MLRVLRDETQKKEARMWAASAAAPYVHPKLKAVDHIGGGGGKQVVNFIVSKEDMGVM